MMFVTANGATLPALGFGTFRMSGADTERMVAHVLNNGYRHIDTAQIYGNEAAVGTGIRASGVKRADLFLTTKVWVEQYRRADFLASVDESLKKLQTDHVDLLLLHWPSDAVGLDEQIDALNAVAAAGKARHIGVSNFTVALMDAAARLSPRPLANNQIEHHPYLSQAPVIAAAKRLGLSLTGYYAMADGTVLSDPALQALAGAHGLMVLPAMVYPAKPRETLVHFRGVASATDLPIMLYNNPPAYRTDVTPTMLASLTDVDTIVAFKESSGDTRRIVDVRNMTGDRFIPLCGLDDVVVESVLLGAVGWISGMSNIFPREGETLFRLARDRRLDEALPIYDWFMPLLHLDARPDLVQGIKLAEHIAGRGGLLTRPPRLPLEGAERDEVEAIVRKALATRPALPDVGLPPLAR